MAAKNTKKIETTATDQLPVIITLRDPNLTFVFYPDKESMCKAFLPFQEYYESREFAGRKFTMAQFQKYYTKLKGEFTYYQDWSGFNFPLGQIKSALDQKWMKKLAAATPESANLRNQLKEVLDQYGDTYVIGMVDGDSRTLKHELAHAYYSQSKTCSKLARTLITKNIDIYKPLMEKLAQMGYHDKVILDECHAYTLVNKDYLKKQGVWHKDMENIRKRLLAQFEKYKHRDYKFTKYDVAMIKATRTTRHVLRCVGAYT